MRCTQLFFFETMYYSGSKLILSASSFLASFFSTWGLIRKRGNLKQKRVKLFSLSNDHKWKKISIVIRKRQKKTLWNINFTFPSIKNQVLHTHTHTLVDCCHIHTRAHTACANLVVKWTFWKILRENILFKGAKKVSSVKINNNSSAFY